MTEEPGVVGPSRPIALSCNDARQLFPAVLSGNSGLTEWALVEAHLRQCAGCRQEHARLQRVRVARRAASPRRLLTPFRSATGVARTSQTALAAQAERLYALLVGRLLDLRVQLRSRMTSGFALGARTWVRVVSATARGINRCVALGVRERTSLATRLRSWARAVRDAMAACRHRVTRASLPARLHRPPAVRLNTVLPVVIVILGCALAAYTLPGTPRSPQSARPMTSSTAGVERTPAGLFLPPAVPPGDDGASGSRSPQLTFFREIVGGDSAPAASVPARPAPSIDIVGRLSARNRTTAEREVVALLAGVGGTELSRERGATITTIHVLMPQSAHADFLRGLIRIGSWQLEAARSPLRDTVHATVRVTE